MEYMGGGIRDYKLVAFICRFVKVGHYEAEMSKTENFPRLGTKTRPQDQDQN